VREGDNLWVDVPVTFAQATLGAKVEIPTPDGPETLEIAAGTQPMTKQVLSNRGMPNVRGRGRGDLIARIIVQVPRNLPPEARELVAALAPHLGTPKSSSSDSPPSDPENEGGETEKGSVFDRMFRGRKKK
jgi:molecular chaperone DnaJ